jgi:two-component system autoinducer 1 sensor kinase/phosphatase LuxN
MKNCLIIDDITVSRYAVALFLEELGLQTREAEDGPSALQSLKMGQVDVIFLDWHLRRQNGLELIQKLKAASANAPIIVISGVEALAKAPEAKQAGADAFVEKPTTREKIEQALRTVKVL